MNYFYIYNYIAYNLEAWEGQVPLEYLLQEFSPSVIDYSSCVDVTDKSVKNINVPFDLEMTPYPLSHIARTACFYRRKPFK